MLSTTQREAADQVQDLQKQLKTRDTDLNRIRAQREELRGEASQLKARDWDRVKLIDQIKTLNKSQEERIVAYASETTRLRMQVAAANGDAALVETLAKTDEKDLVSDLQSRLK